MEKTPGLQVHILIDCLRGTRVSKGQSSATLLLPLIKEFPEQLKVSMYHTPDLRGLLKRTLPQRFNESIGLMHLKLYGFDDTVMLSG
jgi:CDP-diacylglycerol--glycerol-3-phosphate 3-phosphatidyltransferase